MDKRCASDRQEMIDALTNRYRNGEVSEEVLVASLKNLIDKDEIRYIIFKNHRISGHLNGSN